MSRMKISRKDFFKATAVAALAPRVLAADADTAVKSRKVEKAAIKGSTDALTAFITTATLANMPPDVIAQARRCLVDGFGVMLAGSTVKGS
jgi:hypothetical protein